MVFRSTEEREKQERRLLQFSCLEPFRSRRAGQLSGGMKQKLALTCTLIHSPDVLILDEPTTGVDPLSRQEFWSILRELAASGKALLASTPYMDEANLCDRIALMYEGRTLAVGTPNDVSRLFPRKLIEITGSDIPKVLYRLNRIETIDVHRIGGRVHVAYDDADLPVRLREQFKDARVTIKDVAPSVEETLVHLIEREQTA